jgi:hypothetical protein
MEHDIDYKTYSEIFDGTSLEYKISDLERRNEWLKSNKSKLIDEGKHPNDIYQEIEDNNKQIATYELDLCKESLKYWQQVKPGNPIWDSNVEWGVKKEDIDKYYKTKCKSISRKITELKMFLGHKPASKEREKILSWMLVGKVDNNDLYEYLKPETKHYKDDTPRKAIARYAKEGSKLAKDAPWLEYIYQGEAQLIMQKMQ